MFIQGFTFVAVLLDMCVCYLSKDLDLYGANEDKRKNFILEDTKISDNNKKDKIIIQYNEKL